MGADQIAVIRPILVELEDVLNEMPDAALGYCATFESPPSERAWVQVMLDALNIHFPFDVDPVAKLKEVGIELGPVFRFASWQAGQHATWEIEGWPGARAVAEVVDRIFERLYGLGEDYPLNADIGDGYGSEF